MNNDLFSEFKNRFAPKQEEEVHPADKFLAERRAMMKQREEEVANVLTPEQIAQREAKRLPADKQDDARSNPMTTDESYSEDDADLYFASGAHEMRKEIAMEQIAKIPVYDSMPLGMKEIQEKMGVRDHGLGFFKGNRTMTGQERLVDTYEKYRKDNPEQYVKVSDFKQAMYDALCCNEFLEKPEPVKRGNIQWEDPDKKDKVVFNPDENGKWEISELPQPESLTPKFACGMDPAAIGGAGDTSVSIVRASDHVVAFYQGRPTSEEEFNKDVVKLSQYFNVKVDEEVKEFEPDLEYQVDIPPAPPASEIMDFGNITDNGQEGLFDFGQQLDAEVVWESNESEPIQRIKGRYVDPAPFVDPEQLKPIQDRAYSVEKLTIEEAKERMTYLNEGIDFKPSSEESFDGSNFDNSFIDEVGQMEPVKPHKLKASQVEEHGIIFDSKLEHYFYNLLLAEKINFRFQVPYILQEGFRYRHESILPIKIIMDFVLDDFNCIVDTKGWQLYDNKIKHKMLKKVLFEAGTEMRIEMPGSQKACRKVIEYLRHGFVLEEQLSEGAANGRKNKLKKAKFIWDAGYWIKGETKYLSQYLMHLPKYEFEELLIKHT